MNQISKVQSQGNINVPFSWENEPGVSKVITNQDQDGPVLKGRSLSFKLPPPPCPKGSARFTSHDIQIPLPPCAFQPPSRTSSTKGLDQDPFLAAFKECTKSKSTAKTFKLPKNLANYKKNVFNFSCRKSCSVRDDNLVRISQLPCKRDEER